MGRLKKRQKLAAKLTGQFDEQAADKCNVPVEVAENDHFQYEGSNQLVLPATKSKVKRKVKQIKAAPKLTKKKRKELEKILERKKKKAKRHEVLAELEKVKASPKELSLMVSTTDAFSRKITKATNEFEEEIEQNEIIKQIKGTNRKRKKEAVEEVIRAESSSSEESSDDEEEEDHMSEDSDTEQQPEAEQGTATAATGDKNSASTSDEAHISNDANPTSDKSKVSTATPTGSTTTPTVVNIPVCRDADIQESRLQLPILAEEQAVMESINDNPVVVLCGETGSGKTTQVPQFLYEAGYAHGGSGIIGVTEPRRVAAVSMSKRVRQELNLKEREVSYQIRYEGNVSSDTKILFMTDGVLLKEVQHDPTLRRYSVIILDEAHERSVYTDILIGLLSRIVPLRHKRGNPLKLVIMSATLRVSDFTENTRLFSQPPPVINIDARQFPVTIHFSKKTNVDYLEEAYKKVCKIHKQLPDGGILVFVTGQQEVHTLCRRLRGTFPSQPHGAEAQEGQARRAEKQNTHRGRRRRTSSTRTSEKEVELPKISLDDYSVMPSEDQAELDNDHLSDEETGADLSDFDSEDEEDATKKGLLSSATDEPLHVLPLYSLLSSEQQARVFNPPPPNTRLCVVATNVAETSLTIPNIKYVVDTGKTKTKLYDVVTGVSTFRITDISQASAAQRAGRAGRTSAGHCYRLYSSAVYSDMQQFAPPEITRRPCEDLVLQMKDMNIDRTVNFPFPTPPSEDSLQSAESLLVDLGALKLVTSKKVLPLNKRRKLKIQDETVSRITKLGRLMAKFPVHPRYAKMLTVGKDKHLLPYVILLVSAVTVPELFESSSQDESAQKAELKQRKASQRTWLGKGESLLLGDLMVVIRYIGACDYGDINDICHKHHLRQKAVIEVRKLRKQLTDTVNILYPDTQVTLDPKMPLPSEETVRLLRQIVLTGMVDHVARRMPDLPEADQKAKKLKPYQTTLFSGPCYIHPTSILHNKEAEYVVFQRVEETSRVYIKDITAVDSDWMVTLAKSKCTFSSPLDDPPPRYDADKGIVVCTANATFGPHEWPLHTVDIPYPDTRDGYRWFVIFLLEGEIFPKLLKYNKVLLTKPAIMLKSWARLHQKTEVILSAVVSRKILSRQALADVWQKEPKFLLAAYQQWIPEALHAEVQKVWPPI